MSIQQTTHSSREDALCCLRLLAHKILELQCLADGSRKSCVSLGDAVEYVGDVASALRNAARMPSSLSLFTVDQLVAGDFQGHDEIFMIFMYRDGGNNYIAFRQR